MKYSAVGGAPNGNNARWRFRSTTVKAFMLTLFAFSAVFITYQLIYYVNLTEYQSKETHDRQLELLSGSGDTSIRSGAVVGSAHIPIGVSSVNRSVHFQRGNERKKGKPLLSSKIVGVRPQDLHFYQAQSRESFKCLSTSKKINWNKVNDDYCDCPLDGSDEPSTSACIKGRFFCLRKDGIKDFIPSSRVNDGICDCLDGTDEHSSHVMCKVVT